MTQPDSIMSAEAFASKLAINPAYGLTGTQQITWTELIKARDEAVRNAALEEAAEFVNNHYYKEGFGENGVVKKTWQRAKKWGNPMVEAIRILKTPSKETV